MLGVTLPTIVKAAQPGVDTLTYTQFLANLSRIIDSQQLIIDDLKFLTVLVG